ncbi:MAG TPA: DUF2797 domain-containing protein [Arthrobacter sp.]|nr:DUF2797 domain-containing protein [Arthrobacter sp.]
MEAYSPYLVRGVSWTPLGPVLGLAGADGTAADFQLEAGTELRFQVLTTPGVRHCLGYSTVEGPTARQQFGCLDHNHAERGFQCGRCFARDDFRFLHDIHRSGIAPPGMQAYVDQEHWLYVATFADGASKVGTASHRSKFSRLAEQGAVVARYVGWAEDGRIIRRLEDAVTEHLGLGQAIRSAAKLAALANPLPPEELERINSAKAAEVRSMLDGGNGLRGSQTVSEQWHRPEASRGVCEAGPGVLYPHDLGEGRHGLRISAAHGSYVRAGIDDSDVEFLADLSRLKGKRIEFGPYSSDVPAVQEFLF